MSRKKTKPLEGIVVDYEPADFGKPFEKHQVVDLNRKGAVEYVVNHFVGEVEKKIVSSPTDPIYQATSTIAKRVTSNRATGSILALGVYYLLKNISGDEEDVGVNEREVKRLTE